MKRWKEGRLEGKTEGYREKEIKTYFRNKEKGRLRHTSMLVHA